MFSVKEVTRPGPDRPLGSVPVGTTFMVQGRENHYIRVSDFYALDHEGLVAVACLDNGLLHHMSVNNPVYLIDIEGSVSLVDKE